MVPTIKLQPETGAITASFEAQQESASIVLKGKLLRNSLPTEQQVYIPENGWLEDEFLLFFWDPAYFEGAKWLLVSGSVVAPKSLHFPHPRHPNT